MIQTTLKIDGMMCGMCEAHISDTVRRSFLVKKVSSSRKKGECVILSEEPLDHEKLTGVIKATGYELKSIREEPYEKKGLFGRR